MNTAMSDSLTSESQTIQELSQLSRWKGLRAVVSDWTLIVLVFATAVGFPNPLTWVIAAVIIAMRQHALLIIMHDASHHRLLLSRAWNDRLSNWCLAWPLLVSTEGYRANHLAHHIHLNTDADPDWIRKQGRREWEFPKTKWEFLRLLLRDVFGGGLIDQIKAIRDLSGNESGTAKERSSAVERICYYCLLAAAIIIFNIWLPVLLLWFLPAFTVLPAILRIRGIAEHFGVEGETELNASRNMHPTWWERLTVAPHNAGYHLDHHLYPGVPFYNLPRLHRLLSQQSEYAERSHQSQSLFGNSPSSVFNEVSAAG